MKVKLLLIVFCLNIFTFSSCSSSKGTTVKVVKPKYHHRRYERKNDKRVKRTKLVKVKN